MSVLVPGFTPDSTPQAAHAGLRRSLAVVEQAQHCAVLWFAEIQSRGWFRQLGYSSMQAYATESLGFSRAKCADFVRLAAKLEQLPRLRESVARGEVGYTKARELIKVATPRTEERWVAEAAKSSRVQLAAKVARVKKKAADRRRHPGQAELLPTARIDEALVREVPQRVALEMTPEQFARWEALWEQVHKLGGGDRMDELLEALAGRVAELGTSSGATHCFETNSATRAPRGARPAAVIHVHECRTCGQATVQTSRGELPLAEATIERIRGDAIIAPGDHRARSAIPPRTRREVLRRDRHRCQAPGCTHTRFLEIHHKRPVARGGGHEAANLVTLCSACHRFMHQKGT